MARGTATLSPTTKNKNSDKAFVDRNDLDGEIEAAALAVDAQDWQAQKKHLVQAVANRCKEAELFKSQQRGDPDLTKKEKADLAEQLLERSPALFLARFGHLLGTVELQWMADKFKDEDYEVAFHLRRLGSEACKVNANRRAKNRRYAAVTRMLSSSDDYFSETGMRRRNPLLYHKMVGRHLSEEERRQRQKDEGEAGQANCSLTNIILEHMDINKERDLKKVNFKHHLVNQGKQYSIIPLRSKRTRRSLKNLTLTILTAKMTRKTTMPMLIWNACCPISATP